MHQMFSTQIPVRKLLLVVQLAATTAVSYTKRCFLVGKFGTIAHICLKGSMNKSSVLATLGSRIEHLCNASVGTLFAQSVLACYLKQAVATCSPAQACETIF